MRKLNKVLAGGQRNVIIASAGNNSVVTRAGCDVIIARACFNQVIAIASGNRHIRGIGRSINRVVASASIHTHDAGSFSLRRQFNRVTTSGQHQTLYACHFGKRCIGNRSRRGQLDRVIITATFNRIVSGQCVMRKLNKVLAGGQRNVVIASTRNNCVIAAPCIYRIISSSKVNVVRSATRKYAIVTQTRIYDLGCAGTVASVDIIVAGSRRDSFCIIRANDRVIACVRRDRQTAVINYCSTISTYCNICTRVIRTGNHNILHTRGLRTLTKCEAYVFANRHVEVQSFYTRYILKRQFIIAEITIRGTKRRLSNSQRIVGVTTINGDITSLKG